MKCCDVLFGPTGKVGSPAIAGPAAATFGTLPSFRLTLALLILFRVVRFEFFEGFGETSAVIVLF